MSLQDVRRDALGRKLNADQTQTLIDRLVKAGWLREIKEGRGGPGRPARRWAVNAKLFDALAMLEMPEIPETRK